MTSDLRISRLWNIQVPTINDGSITKEKDYAGFSWLAPQATFD